MSKISTPLKLYDFQVITEGVSPKQVTEAIGEMMSWMRREQEAFYRDEFQGVVRSGCRW